MADFGKSLGNLALAATVSLAPMQSNAADVSKLPEAVIAKCKADTILALADFRARIDAAAPTSSQEVTADRLARYERRFSVAVEGCLDVAVIRARSDELTAQSNELKAQSNELKAQSNELKARSDQLTARIDQLTARSDQLTARIDQLTARSNELDVSGKALMEVNTELKQKLAFFDDFMAGRKTRDEYNIQIASLSGFVEMARARYVIARKVYANNPSMLASIDETETGLRKITAFVSGFQTASSIR
jgi:cell division protein FtsB